jgi:hypothetical protein
VSRNPSLACWLPVVLLLLAPLLAQAAPSACDPLIRPNPDHPQGYRDRGDQLCEGIYATEVSSLGLTLASFTGPTRGIDLARKAQFRFQWRAVGQGDVKVRADSLRPRFYYRMDSVWSGDATQMSWTNAIPAQYELRTREFGVLATQKDKSGKLIYLPVHIMQGDRASQRSPYVATVISGAEIDEIYWSLAIEGSDKYIVYDEPLDRKPYSANLPIAINLDKVVTPGRYLLTISAELLSGSSDSVQVPFYHSP